MAVKYESYCVDCGFPCLGTACPNYSVPVYSCDECGDDELDEVYEVDGEDLCEDCLKMKFLKKE